MRDGEYAGQLELVDGQVGRNRTTEVLVLGPKFSPGNGVLLKQLFSSVFRLNQNYQQDLNI